MFSLHVIQAEHGDCFLLEFDAVTNRGFILVDGGPSGVFNNSLSKVLEAEVRPDDGCLDCVILSHIDSDHITGLIDMLAELKAQRESGRPELVSIAGLWHNSFTRTLDPANTLNSGLRNLLAIAGTGSVMSHAVAWINSIAQGNKLRQFAEILKIPLNPSMPDPITVESAWDLARIGNLTLNVVGPTRSDLEALHNDWEKWMEKHEDGIAAGNLEVMIKADDSIPNLSSICVVAHADGRTILLTGDALGDHLLDGLTARGLLDSSGQAHFDVLKVPHHGSDRNITKTFFRNVTADRYVISANGKNDNPDLTTLAWLVEAAKEQGRRPEVYVTNRTESTSELEAKYPAADYGYELHFLPDQEASMEIALA